MLRYLDNWINPSKKYEDALSDEVVENDLSLRGSYSFYKNYFQMTGKTALLTESDDKTKERTFKSKNEFELEIKLCPLSNIVINQKIGEITAESDVNFWQDEGKNHSLSVYNKHGKKDGEEFESAAQLVYNYQNSYLVNLGLKNFQLLNKESIFGSALLSFGFLSKLNFKQNLCTWGGVELDFKKTTFQNLNLLVGASYDNFNGNMNLLTEKVDSSPNNDTNKGNDDTKNVNDKTTISTNYTLKFNVEAKVNEDLALYSSAQHALNSDESKNGTNVTVGGIFSLDGSTKLSWNLKNDFSGVASLTKSYNKNVQFTFAGSLKYVQKEKSYFDTKFGISLDLGEGEN